MSSSSDLLKPFARGDDHSPRDVELRSRWLPVRVILLSLSVICISCGGVVSDPPPATVTVMPGSTQPYTGDSVQFSAVVQNIATSAINWQVNGVAGGNLIVGTIDSTGLYAAPALVPNPPTVTVTAVLQSNLSDSRSSSVTILSLSSIQGPLALSPVLSSVTTSQTLQLQVLTAGVTNNLVNWAVAGVRGGNAGVSGQPQRGLDELLLQGRFNTKGKCDQAARRRDSVCGKSDLEMDDRGFTPELSVFATNPQD